MRGWATASRPPRSRLVGGPAVELPLHLHRDDGARRRHGTLLLRRSLSQRRARLRALMAGPVSGSRRGPGRRRDRRALGRPAPLLPRRYGGLAAPALAVQERGGLDDPASPTSWASPSISAAGIRPGDGLEDFKRGFANAELPFHTHEIVCDRAAYDRLSRGRGETDYFPAYRAPRASKRTGIGLGREGGRRAASTRTVASCVRRTDTRNTVRRSSARAPTQPCSCLKPRREVRRGIGGEGALAFRSRPRSRRAPSSRS